ncbi:CDGSH iron-sulfur domain-containing protein [Desulfosporosinus sp. OT]|uniref:CDGSH iron-sulfur domain-containing protein n=1 Tax=Desulfosporosinus sp. OT TaxID=913865 RepID=UPI000223ACDC|nr:CDGSH iron-sulfur domain-containing protein [Desulfosporosinus sp. OT]EGW36218.1 zinc finger CDGSH type family protein [Desulfosporosinus sp. OT]
MSDKNQERKIKIIKNGPYIVTGNVPLSEKIIAPKGKGYEYKEGRSFPQPENYALCRCGKSKNPPFCDGSHDIYKFDGTETASQENYIDRASRQEGSNLDLLDDDRCAFARFCHRQDGNVWELTDESANPKCREEAIKAASDCPAGRLVAVDKNGNLIEPIFEPSIEILQDPEKKVSASIFVKGNIPIESSDGLTYEVRNRVALCRCGKSSNKPFCDATHISVRYVDNKVDNK